jgi:hypothetical protein
VARVVEYTGRMGSNSKLLRTDAAGLVAAAGTAFLLSAFGIRVAGVGFVDAHELALFAGLLLWCAGPRRCWHVAAAAVHVLFAAATLAHWEVIVSGGMVSSAMVTTALHLVFAGLEGLAARTTEGRAVRPTGRVAIDAA